MAEDTGANRMRPDIDIDIDVVFVLDADLDFDPHLPQLPATVSNGA